MVKKVILLLSMFFILVGCSTKGEYVPTALVSNISFNKENHSFEFQLEINDKSENLISAKIALVTREEIIEITYNTNQSLYSFKDVTTDEECYIKVYASYNVNNKIVKDNEILTLNITNYLSYNKLYFSSQTFLYTGDNYSIFVSNLPEDYEVKYEGNNQTEVGIHEVKAKIYSEDKLIDTLTAYLIITLTIPELIVEDQIHNYTGNEINVDYQISNNAYLDITYNDSYTIPSEVGIYEVKFMFGTELLQIITLEIKIVEIEIYATNKSTIYNEETHSIDVSTNIECKYTILYNNEEELPVDPGVYSVVITVEDTNNIKGSVKHVTLSILEEEPVLSNSIFISQVIHINDYDIYFELYNPTYNDIDLSNYKLLIGNIDNNKTIELDGVIKSSSTYSIVSSNTSLIEKFDQYSDYLVCTNTDSISLFNEEVIDSILLNNNFNYSRVQNKNIYSNVEWEYSDEINSLNEHIAIFDEVNEFLEITYTHKNYINFNSEYNFNDYINVTLNNNKFMITEEMVITNNINTNLFGEYSVVFEIQNYEFTVYFTVIDLQAPIISESNNSLSFELNEEIDYLSLVNVVDNYSEEITITYDATNVDITNSGVYEVIYYATDEFNNESIYKLYIFIKS